VWLPSPSHAATASLQRCIATTVGLAANKRRRATASGMPMSLYSPKKQGDVALKAHVASVCFKCFRCFRGMLQVFHTNVAKVDRRCCICCNDCIRMLQVSVSNVSSVFSDVCCKCVYLDVVYVSHICCKCFIWILRMFAMVFKCFFSSV
jgi:hypothetical protein